MERCLRMNHGDLPGTQNERNVMAHSRATENEQLETRSVEQVEYCTCCSERMTHVEVLESYLGQRIEQALEVCSALSAEYDNGNQIELLAKIADSLVRAASLTEIARFITEGEANG